MYFMRFLVKNVWKESILCNIEFLVHVNTSAIGAGIDQVNLKLYNNVKCKIEDQC